MNPLQTLMIVAWITIGGTSCVFADASTLAGDTDAAETDSTAMVSTAPSSDDSTKFEESSPLAGQWRAAETVAENEQRLGAIARATEDMSRFKRGKARSRLADRTSPPPRLTIAFEGSQVTIITGDVEFELELGAAPIEISVRGESTRLSAEMVGERLVVVADSEAGARRSTYSVEGDHLSKAVVLTSDRLAEELTFVTTYRRVDRASQVP